MHYIAIIHKEEGSCYGVSFPDFPGCIAAGDTLEDARRNAAEALQFHIEGMLEDKEPLPDPSSLDAVMEEEDFQDGVAFVVDIAPPSRRVRVNITLDEALLHDIDLAAKRFGKTRSAFLVDAARQAMGN